MPVPRTVIVTGGTAGVGRAVVEMLARRGDRIGIIARGREGLAATRAAVERLGGTALELPCDVADASQVEAAADKMVEAHGPIDVWVNAAMVTVFSKVRDLTPEELRRVTEVTYLGNVYGIMAAYRRMREQADGTIVQIGSSLAYRGIPLQAAYCGAKHAIKGFLDSLHSELIHENSRIKLTTVHIPAVNTPQFDWARTHTGLQPRPVAPVFQPEAIARHVMEAIDNPAREYWVGGSTPMVIAGSFVAPGLMDMYLARTTVTGQERPEWTDPDRRDNLFEPVEGKGLHRAHGSFDREAKSSTLGIAAESFRAVAAGAILAVAGGLALGGTLLDRGGDGSERRRRQRDMARLGPGPRRGA
ncbi:SDR family oxidoreductase [Indioceanicola profundi]|uniref:SDR family oxidoreductase n=1 Tax=Indioceanicola profundi TaxID=2220096 RepID=UPI000E6ADEE6|nr:SDR family oxidoreductase [Indioceanicola profundi]